LGRFLIGKCSCFTDRCIWVASHSDSSGTGIVAALILAAMASSSPRADSQIRITRQPSRLSVLVPMMAMAVRSGECRSCRNGKAGMCCRQEMNCPGDWRRVALSLMNDSFPRSLDEVAFVDGMSRVVFEEAGGADALTTDFFFLPHRGLQPNKALPMSRRKCINDAASFLKSWLLRPAFRRLPRPRQ
jgi:hypothetical protein